MNPYAELKVLAQELPEGTSKNGLLCPFCKGGRSGEHSLSLHVREDGVALFICFRASCGKHGRMQRNGHVVASDDPPPQRPFSPRGFEEKTRQLNSEERETLWALYGLTLDDIHRHRLAISEETQRLVVPIIGCGGNLRGFEARILGGNGPKGAPKTLHYRQVDQPWIGWFSANVPYINLLLLYVLLSNPVNLIEYIYLLNNKSRRIIQYGLIIKLRHSNICNCQCNIPWVSSFQIMRCIC